MIELCKINRLRVVRDTPQGLYLEDAGASVAPVTNKQAGAVGGSDDNTYADELARNTQADGTGTSSENKRTGQSGAPAAKFTGKREDVLLPRAEVPEGVKAGDELDVFIYLDSSDRYTATLKTPGIALGRMARLKIVQVTDIGVFLDWGLAKNLLLPFKEIVMPCYYDPLEKQYRDADGQVKVLPVSGNKNSDVRISVISRGKAESDSNRSDRKGKAALSPEELAWFHEGRELPVVLYIDKTGRPAASMRIYDHLETGGGYATDSAVEATVIRINPQLGCFVAVDDRFYGMINIKEIVKPVNVGDRIFGRVSGVRDDGKYMISLTQKAHLQMDNDAQTVLKRVREAGGELALGDKSDAKDIMRELGMSKKAFKRAVGQLYKAGKVTPGEYSVREIKM